MAFPGTGKIWMNGSLVDWEDAKIHIASHVVHYGSGVFEGARCYDTQAGRACFRLDAHMRRLIDSARIYRMDVALRPADADRRGDGTDPGQRVPGLLHPPARLPRLRLAGREPGLPVPDVAIMLWEWGAYFTKEADRGRPRRQDLRPGPRNAPNTTPAMAKSVANYANAQLIKMEAVADGYAEGIALDTEGNLSEGSGQNVFIVRDGRHLHAADLLVRPVGHHARLGDHDRPRPRLRGARADAAARNAVSGRRGVLRRDGRRGDADPSVDRIKVGRGRRGPVTEAIQQRFFQIVKGDAPDTTAGCRSAAAHAAVDGRLTRGRSRPIERAGVPGHRMHVNDLLKIAVERGASDLHLKVGSFPMMRVRGVPDARGPGSGSTTRKWWRWRAVSCPRRIARSSRTATRSTWPTAWPASAVSAATRSSSAAPSA